MEEKKPLQDDKLDQVTGGVARGGLLKNLSHVLTGYTEDPELLTEETVSGNAVDVKTKHKGLLPGKSDR